MPIGLNDTDIQVDYGGGNIFNVDIPKYLVTTTTEVSDEEIPIVNKDILTRTQYDTGSDVTSGLVAHYKFDGDLTDSSGNGNIMELITSSSSSLTNDFVDGVIDESLKLQGSKYKITSTILPGLFDSDIWSIALYVKVDSFSNRSTIITRYDSNQNPRCGFSVVIDTAGLINFERLVSGNAWKTVKSNTIVSLNTWYHVVFKCEPYKLQMYVNGVLDDELTFTQTYNKSVTHDLVGIGAFMQGGTPSTNETFYAYLDDLRIYNKALSPTDITDLYNLGAVNIAEGYISGTNAKYIAYQYTSGNDNGSRPAA